MYIIHHVHKTHNTLEGVGEFLEGGGLGFIVIISWSRDGKAYYTIGRIYGEYGV